ncbi:BUD13 homolog [Eublepharis macularius]|uniref:BUD13 homolog n=1 Tax=Eublepharis macularius TaxID=481883 RepID=A0AA97KAL5_EUBMA|nr:BUD13 homolog [Eublepharis macularius]
MAAAEGLSKAEYLRRRYLEPGGAEAEAEAAKKRRRRKRPKERPGGMRIVDDDVSWKSISNEQGKEEEEELEDGDLPMVAEFIDERPEEVKWMEEFRTSNKWKLLGNQNEESLNSDVPGAAKSNSSEAVKHQKAKHLPEWSPPRRGRLDSPGGKNHPRTAGGSQEEYFPDKHLTRQRQPVTSDLSPPRRKTHDSDTSLLPPRKLASSPPGLRKQGKARGSSLATKKCQRHDSQSDSSSPPPRTSPPDSSDSDLSPARPVCSGRLQSSSPDLSPPRRNRGRSSDSDLSPPRKGRDVGQKSCRSRSPPDLSPLRRTKDSKGKGAAERVPQMLSGGKAGLVSADLLRRERQELQKQARSSRHLEDESQHAATVFRDKSGRKRDLKQERLDQHKAAQEKSERDEQYARWGKGLAQSRQQQQNVEDAVKEMHKPLARYIDDQDLDQMLREQEREGDPMANFMRKRKSKERRDRNEKPRYSGPAPPLNRFNIWPGYRWDGVDRSNGFEQKRFARIASKKAVQELAYKWSVEDM